MDFSLALAAAAEAAHAAGKLLRDGFEAGVSRVDAKRRSNDPVTEYDRASERILLTHLQERFPGHGVLSEEGTDLRPSSRYRWILDPLDGTNNYVRGIPHIAVSIALMDSGEPRVGCVYDPLRDELFAAVAGAGATLNQRTIGVSGVRELSGAVVAVGYSIWPERRRKTHRTAAGLLEEVAALRTTGSAALDQAYVASGRLDAMWYDSLSPWDVAAGALLVREAGGAVSSLSGRPLDDPEHGVVATNGWLHREMIARASGEVTA